MSNRRTMGRTPGLHAGVSPYQPPKIRVICDGVEERFPTEAEATTRFNELKTAGRKPVQCSF